MGGWLTILIGEEALLVDQQLEQGLQQCSTSGTSAGN